MNTVEKGKYEGKRVVITEAAAVSAWRQRRCWRMKEHVY